jgi:perosamine synthetase
MKLIPISKPFLTEDEAQAAYDTVLSGWVTQGPKVAEFEKKFASYVGSKYAVAVSSCTTALHLSLIVSGVKSGDEIICPSMSFIATANSIRYSGGIPVFADCRKEDYNIDPQEVEKLITRKTKGIMIVHQMGIPAEIDKFKKICKKHKLFLIEDAACAIGSEYKNKKIGSHSDLICFSFHPRKVITTGDGGMITTSNKEFYERLKQLRQHGMTVNDLDRHNSTRFINEDYVGLGYNYRLTDIQAAIGIKQLEKIEMLIKGRSKIAEIYNQKLSNLREVNLPKIDVNDKTNYQSYPVYINNISEEKRDEIIQSMLDFGIGLKKGIMLAHKTSSYKYLKQKNPLLVSEDLSSHSVLLPLYPGLESEEINNIIYKFKRIVGIKESNLFTEIKDKILQIQEIPFLYNLSQKILAFGSENLIPLKLREVFKNVKINSSILDDGCGPSSRLWKLGYKPTGLDVSKSYVTEFNRISNKAKLGSADKLPFKNLKFDRVWSFGLLHHLEDLIAKKSIDEMIRVCKKAGQVLIFDAVLPTSFWAHPMAYIIRSLDRGSHMRKESDFDKILPNLKRWKKERYIYSKTGLELLILSYKK